MEKDILQRILWKTSWFIVDTEGNVAIVDFGDDGSVSDFVGYHQNCYSEVMFETIAENENGGIPCLRLTDEQIDVMFSYSKLTKEQTYSFTLWYETKKDKLQHTCSNT